MKAKIVGGKFDGAEFEVSTKTQEEIEKKTDKYYNVKEYCKKNMVFYNYKASFVEATTLGGYNHVRVPLPQANIEWTFAAFDWVKAFCERFEGTYNGCWPHHVNSNNNAGYLWIKI